MAEEKQFARKASGLVRGLSLMDAFLVGFMNQGLTASVWVTISLGLSVYTGGNLIIASLLSLILCGIGIPLVWGILGGSMPRSGGEYIYNSRILHPLIGIAASFGNAFVWIMWIYILAPWVMDPGMVMLFNFLGQPAAAEWCSSTAGIIVGASVVNIIAFLFLVFGMKVFAKAQKAVVGVAMIGALIILIAFAVTPHDTFKANWDRLQIENATDGAAEVSLLDNVDTTDQSTIDTSVKALLIDRVAMADIINPADNTVIVSAGQAIDESAIIKIAQLNDGSTMAITSVKVKPLDYTSYLNVMAKVMDTTEGKSLPITWNWFDTFGVMVAASWLFMYSYCITYIAGEVKRPDKSILLGNLFSVVVPVVYMVLIAIFLYNTVGFQFLSATAWADQTGTTIAGYTLPWSPSFMGLGGVITQNPILLFLIALSFILFNVWYVALSYLAFPRILFAWGMDRMGPRWMSDVSPRWATPVKNYLLCFILGEIGIVLYALFQDTMSGLTVTALEVVTVFGVTAIAALLFPYLKKVRNIWLASPYRTWKFLSIPAITWGAVFYLIYLGIVFVFYVAMPGFEGLTLPSLILFAGIWVFGILWYLFWKWRNKKAGVDVSMTYGELPPD
jgi:amino acid transporter